jgi:hypothetical protein
MLACAGPEVAGCGALPSSDGAGQENAGTIGLNLALPGGTTIASASYVVTGPNGFTKTGSLDVSHSQTLSAVIGGLPVGDGYSIELQATSTDGSLSCTGSASFSVVAHATSAVTVHLSCRQAAGSGSVAVNGVINVCAVADGISLDPADVEFCFQVAATVSAHDIDAGPAPLTYSWSATSGFFDDPTSATPSFTCTKPGTVSLTVAVSDGDPACTDAVSADLTCEPGDESCIAPGSTCTEGQQCCSQRCDMTQGSVPGFGACGDNSVLAGPLATLPADLKQQDFRLSPPVVLDTTASRAADDSTDISVVFAPDSRLDKQSTLELALDDSKLVLTRQSNSDGSGNSTFTGNVAIAYKDTLAAEVQAGDVAHQVGEDTVPQFLDREFVGSVARPEVGGDSIHIVPRPLSIFDNGRSLLITDPRVIHDTTRTYDPCTGEGTPLGAWTFGKLMTDMAGSMAPGAFVESWFSTFLVQQVINGSSIAPEPQLSRGNLSNVLAHWPRNADHTLDVSQAPFELVAIVNRTDLAGNSSYGSVSSAEGRFVFALTDKTENNCRGVNTFLVIFEYGVPLTTCTQLRDWAQSWLTLSTISLDDAAFNPALQALTDRFAAAGADPSKPNGSALDQLRTNANIDPGWELREFHLQVDSAPEPLLTPAPTAQTPIRTYNNGNTLGNWISHNVPLTGSPFHAGYTVPLVLPVPCTNPPLCTRPFFFRAGVSFNLIDYWTAPGPTNDQLFRFSFNTCDGCHGQETHTPFAQISTSGNLSAFLTGETVPDPRNMTTQHTFNDLLRRMQFLETAAGSSCNGRLAIPPVALSNLLFPRPIPPLGLAPILAAD